MVKVSAADWGWVPPALPRRVGWLGMLWPPPQPRGTSPTGVCARAKEEQGLLTVSGYRAVLAPYCNLHTTCLYLFVLSGMNYALQMVMKSFVT